MSKPYSNITAMLAITKASLKASFKSPQSVFFSLFFPIVLISIFGALGGKGTASVDIAFDSKSDTANLLYNVMHTVPVLNIERGTATELMDKLKKGRITALIDIQPIKDSSTKAKYDLKVISSSASGRDLPLLNTIINDIKHRIDNTIDKDRGSYTSVSNEQVPGRAYKMIDFMLPGMIGFSLIGAAVFGVAFSFYSFRETLVLKRMYASPIQRIYILLGEGLSRVIFQLTTVIVLILFGKYVHGFTLAQGAFTFIHMLLVSFIALLVFMGFGFFISGIAKNQNVIPIYANLFMFPQYFLSGTFFPKTALPMYLQNIIKFLPLTAVNDAMRNIAFEGASIFSCGPQIAVLAAWGVLVYLITAKFFKWE